MFRKIQMLKDVCLSQETSHFLSIKFALFKISIPDSLRLKKDKRSYEK